MWWIVTVLVASVAVLSGRCQCYQRFEAPSPHASFTHLVALPNASHLYVGAVNHIYQLDPQLRLEAKAVMGPGKDSNPAHCPAGVASPPSCPPADGLSDYWNKALAIDLHHQWLISCGTLHQGSCTIHRLANISQLLYQPTESVVATAAQAASVVFVAPGPTGPVLYVGASNLPEAPQGLELPVVSSRSLEANSESFAPSTDCNSNPN